MIYLLAKFTLLFLLATILGFVLGYWWSRRNFVDVSESYEDLRKATEKTDATNWERLWGRLDALPEPRETDLAPVFASLDTVSSAVAGIPKPAPVDFAPVESRLESLASQIANIPQPEKPKDPDLRPLTDRIQKLEQEIRAIPAPADINPLSKGLQNLETAVRNIPAPVDINPLSKGLQNLETVVRNIPAPPRPQEVDLQPVRKDLLLISDKISSLPKVERSEPVNLVPVVRQIDALERRVGAMPRPEKVDLKPIDNRLRLIESEIGKLGSRLARPAPAKRQEIPKTPRPTQQPKKSTKEPRILSGAIYGTKDDLKRISGVGPMLEKLLNKNGVYYFWQVASWSEIITDLFDYSWRSWCRG